MKIKMIDLLSKVVKGEEVPRLIKYSGLIWEYSDKFQDYDSEICLFNNYMPDLEKSINRFLNEEAEIIEENKEIEKLGKIYDGFGDSYYDTCLVKIAQKVDEVIDAVNKLKVDD